MKTSRIHNALILYHSKTGGTRKLAMKIAQGLGCHALELEQIEDTRLEEYDLLVLGSPVHGDLPSDPIKTFLGEPHPLPPLAAIFCAHAADEHFVYSPMTCLKVMTEALEKRGALILGSFHARSENSDPEILEWLKINMPERHPGALSSKGHPNASELEAAFHWGCSIKELIGKENSF